MGIGCTCTWMSLSCSSLKSALGVGHVCMLGKFAVGILVVLLEGLGILQSFVFVMGSLNLVEFGRMLLSIHMALDSLLDSHMSKIDHFGLEYLAVEFEFDYMSQSLLGWEHLGVGHFGIDYHEYCFLLEELVLV